MLLWSLSGNNWLFLYYYILVFNQFTTLFTNCNKSATKTLITLTNTKRIKSFICDKTFKFLLWSHCVLVATPGVKSLKSLQVNTPQVIYEYCLWMVMIWPVCGWYTTPLVTLFTSLENTDLNQHHISRCTGESNIETNAGSRQWWGWDGNREPRRYFRDSIFHCESPFPLPCTYSSLLPHSLAPIALTATLVGNSLVFLSHSVYLVFSLCMIIVFQLLSSQWPAKTVLHKDLCFQ